MVNDWLSRASAACPRTLHRNLLGQAPLLADAMRMAAVPPSPRASHVRPGESRSKAWRDRSTLSSDEAASATVPRKNQPDGTKRHLNALFHAGIPCLRMPREMW
jgi:hypothetical protein